MAFLPSQAMMILTPCTGCVTGSMMAALIEIVEGMSRLRS
jgi:hypothetical protein